MAADTFFALALISMPWPIFNRPSIQIASLKSYLDKEDDLQPDCFHPYLDIARRIGTDRYREIAHSGWAGEALFSSLVFPEKANDARTLFYESLRGNYRQPSRHFDFEALADEISDCCLDWLVAINPEKYQLFGFSLCFSQLLPSLYMADLVKKRLPSAQVVFGGSSCCGKLGKSIADNFASVDFVVDGEGEETLVALCRYLQEKSPRLPAHIFVRAGGKSPQQTNPCPEGLDINRLPAPDYRDYFKQMQQLFGDQPFIPSLPVEFSRGCWWNNCSFCNLNIQWQGYRHKSAPKMVKEVVELAKNFQSLHFTFTDNTLPPAEAELFFTELRRIDIDVDFFAEIRAITGSERLEIYREGGLSTVQIGIEALSTSLLKKMAKGTTTIDNIAVMKICSQHNIHMEGNLITEFPSTSKKEINETLINLDFVLPFLPLDNAGFFLGYGSPVYHKPRDFNIAAVVVHSKNKKLFPAGLLSSMTMLLSGYRGDRGRQQELWKPVRQKIKDWKEFHHRRTGTSHPLHYRDGGSFLIIRQEKLSGPPLQHRLQGLSRKIYIACEKITPIEDILRSFPQLKAKTVEKFIAEMCAKQLMFRERGRVLSLAVRKKSKS
jgi:ribosomal peptide maturation radical SAM protein 1